MYNSLFEKLKFQSKKLYYQNKLKQQENNIKTHGKSKVYNYNFPKILNIDKKEITDQITNSIKKASTSWNKREKLILV